ncbi:unnamed protein product [Paramecium primaurelia]|uniref:RING-type domain-containing protein n=1 Tax=Paramecium primaurelia TaxID=5886 RepID=A0A8S1QKC1_PARPR|nr:unnamed protein product [Paramecium primaurelia]
MNYEQFQDDGDDKIQCDQSSLNIDQQELQLIIDLSQTHGFDIIQSIYAIHFKGFRTIFDAIIYLQNNDSHRQVEQTKDSSGVCKQVSQFNPIFEQDDQKFIAELYKIKYNLQSTQQCCVCYMIFLDKDLLYLKQEKHNICLDCFINYLRQQINEGKINNLKCPHCNIQIMDNDILEHSQELYTKYLKCYQNLEIALNPNKAWCPTVNCQNVLEFKQEQMISTCAYCKIEVCKGCKQRAHPLQSCEENLQHILNEWQEDRETQQCPRCKIIVEKISGCNHMTCQFCLHEWCWICKSDYTSLHFAIFNPFGCPALLPGRIQQKNFSYVKLLIWRLICLILLIILTPIVAVMTAPFLCIALLIQIKCFQNLNIFIQAFLFMITLLFGIALIPITIIIFIITLLPFILGLIVYYYYERRRLEIKHQTALSRHFQLNP